MNLNKIIIYIKNPLPLLSTLAFADYTYYKRRLKAYTIIQNL